MPLRIDLIKAGILTPDAAAYDPKASLVDPLAYGSMAYGYKEKYALLDYSKCRQITYADPVVAGVIQTRLNQVAMASKPQPDKYSVGFKIKMRDTEARPKPGDKAKIKELEQFILNCGVPENFDDTPEIKKRDGFEVFLRKITRDSLTFDQVNFEITPRRDGKPYSFQAVDAATIRIIPDRKEMVERLAADSKYDVTNIIDYGSSKYFKEFKPKNPRYAQVINGVVRHVFDEWELAFGVRNPRTDVLAIGYGFSEIEMLVTTITSHMNAETYNRKFFSQGSSVKGILSFEGKVPPDQLEAFRRQWYQQVTGVNNAWRTPIMSLGEKGKLNWTDLHSTNREMEFGKWLDYCVKIICAVFQMDPIEIGFDISRQSTGQNSTSGGLGQGHQAERIAFSQDKGLRPLLVFVQSLINDYIVYRLDPNFEFEFVGLNGTSEDEAIDRNTKKVTHFQTINEIRAENDMEPLPDFDDIKNPGDVVLDSSMIQMITGQLQAKQQQDMQDQMPGGENGPGVEPGGGKRGQDQEPDYENMSMDELQAELDRLQQPQKPQSGKEPAKGAGTKALVAPQAQGKPGQPKALAGGKAQEMAVKSVSGALRI